MINENKVLKRLCAHMVARHLIDVKSKSPSVRKEAISWIYGLEDYEIDFSTVCHIAGFDADWIRRKLSYLIDKVKNERF